MKKILFIFLIFIGSFELLFAAGGVCNNSHDGGSFPSLTSFSGLCSVGAVDSFISDPSGWSWVIPPFLMEFRSRLVNLG